MKNSANETKSYLLIKKIRKKSQNNLILFKYQAKIQNLKFK